MINLLIHRLIVIGWLFVARLLLSVCGTNLIGSVVIGYLWHDCYCLFVARISLTSQPSSSQPASGQQPASAQPAGQPARKTTCFVMVFFCSHNLVEVASIYVSSYPPQNFLLHAISALPATFVSSVLFRKPPTEQPTEQVMSNSTFVFLCLWILTRDLYIQKAPKKCKREL